MKTFFTELLQYDYKTNDELIRTMSNNSNAVSEKSTQLISHIVNVHKIWNLKIQPIETPPNPWELHAIDSLVLMNEVNFATSKSIIENFDLNQIISWQTKNGQVFNNTVRDILFQIINHSNYHRAQIATEFKTSGIQPLLTDFIYYKMKFTK